MSIYNISIHIKEFGEKRDACVYTKSRMRLAIRSLLIFNALNVCMFVSLARQSCARLPINAIMRIGLSEKYKE